MPSIVFEPVEHPTHSSLIAPATATRELARLAAILGQSIRDERRRRNLTIRELASLAGIAVGTVHAAEMGQVCSLPTYLQISTALAVRLDMRLVDPRRRESRQLDPVHAAMGEAEARHLRALGFNVGLDEPFQHYQFAGKGDLVAWTLTRPALIHFENKTDLRDVQDVFGSFNGKRAYLGEELARRVGVDRWLSETHVIAVLWLAECLRTLRANATSFSSVCSGGTAGFAGWWSGRPPEFGRQANLIVFDPEPGKRCDRRQWVGMSELDGLRSRYRDYRDAARSISRRAATATRPPGRPGP